MKTYLSSPSGYCQGVTRAIALALSFKKQNTNKQVYVLGTLVHNENVTNELNRYGIISLDENIPNEEKISKLPDGCALIFSAHGHDNNLDELAKKKNITILDATCPIVEFSKNNIIKAIKDNHQVIFIGTKNHPETTAMLSVSKEVYLYDDIKDDLKKYIKDESPFISNQTTLSIYELEDLFNKLKEIFPKATFQNEICRETRLRQEAIKNMKDDVDVVFIVGGKKSSNTKKLYELAKKHFTTLKIYQILDETEIDPKLVKGCLSAAIISGASTPLNETMKVKVKLDNLW